MALSRWRLKVRKLQINRFIEKAVFYLFRTARSVIDHLDEEYGLILERLQVVQ